MGIINMKNEIIINSKKELQAINKNLYGHFSEHIGKNIYDGIWVGEESNISNTDGFRNDVLEALKRIRIPILRWPGGCFASNYHWKDGIGPRESRPRRVNAKWGNLIENNHFGTNEFLNYCEMLNCEPYICGNVGSGTIKEMGEWLEYINSDGDSDIVNLRKQNGRKKSWNLKYFGIGNENWGCGGRMSIEYYFELYKRYQNFVYSFKEEKLYKIACGPAKITVDSYQTLLNHDPINWVEVLLSKGKTFMDGLSFHYYITPGDSWKNKGSDIDFNNEDWFITLKKTFDIEDFIKEISFIMDKYDPDKKIGLIIDEWGTWYDTEYMTQSPRFLGYIPEIMMLQQNTLRDAMVAGVCLNIFNKHSDRIHIANLSMTVNQLQSIILTDKEKMILTPTYHVFDLLKVHQGSKLLPMIENFIEYKSSFESIPLISASASKNLKGEINISLLNIHPENEVKLNIKLPDTKWNNISGKILTSNLINDHNTFDNPNKVEPKIFNKFKKDGDGFLTILPSKSLTILTIN